jgi:diacylglycerol kinase
MTGTVTAKASGTTCICANALDGSGVQGCCILTVNVNVTNVSMATAKTISDESYTSGHICSLGTEQWFKFTALIICSVFLLFTNLENIINDITGVIISASFLLVISLLFSGIPAVVKFVALKHKKYDSEKDTFTLK